MEAEVPIDGQRWRRRRQRKSLNYSLNLLRPTQPIETIDLTVKAAEAVKTKFTPSTSSRKSETPVKRVKKEEIDDDDESQDSKPRRRQPQRAARYTESYITVADMDVSMPSDEEKAQNGDRSGSDSEEDSDVEIIPNSPVEPLTAEAQLEWENRALALKQKLHNEEIKLVLLRKLKESQSKKEEKKEEGNYSIPPHVKLSHKTSPRSSQLQISNISPFQSPTKKLIPTTKFVQQTQPQDLTKNTRTAQGTSSPNNLVALQTEKLSKSNISIVPVTSKTASTPQRPQPPIKNEVSISIVPSSKPSPQSHPSQHQQQQQHHQPQQSAVDKEITSQQQAVAKMALRKQLEKTLLQIPTPRPKVPRLNFLPNANSPEFIWLLGLDLVVDFITKKKQPPVSQKEPYSCFQCKSSFSEVWNPVKDPNNKKAVICQTCVSSNTKKSLRSEHTGHLKAAFVKALQQEKEIERLSHSFSISSSIPTTTNVSSVAQSSYPQSSQPVFSKASSSSRTASNSPNLFLGNNSLFMQQFAKLSPQQIHAIFQAQAQSFMSANIPLPAHMVPFSPFYPFNLMNKAGTSQNDLHRQYLLDMIPSSSPSCAPAKRKR